MRRRLIATRRHQRTSWIPSRQPGVMPQFENFKRRQYGSWSRTCKLSKSITSYGRAKKLTRETYAPSVAGRELKTLLQARADVASGKLPNTEFTRSDVHVDRWLGVSAEEASGVALFEGRQRLFWKGKWYEREYRWRIDLTGKEVLDGKPFRGSILLGHLHWDHTHGLPFFRAGDHPDARVDLYIPAQGDPVAVLARALSPPHFPITPTELRGNWSFHALEPGESRDRGAFGRRGRDPAQGRAHVRLPRVRRTSRPSPICPTTVRSRSARGPRVWASTTTARCTGARRRHAGARRAIHRGRAARPRRLRAFGDRLRSGPGRARSRPRSLLLFHHDPPRTDDEIDEIERAYQRPDLDVRAAAEGMVIDL